MGKDQARSKNSILRQYKATKERSDGKILPAEV